MTWESVQRQAVYLVKAPLVYRNWLRMLFINYSEQPRVELRLRDGTTFTVRPRTTDRSTLNEMVVTRPYEADSTGTISASDVVVDIGAHIGTFTVGAAKRATRGRVFAIEPVPENFDLLQENVRANRLENVIAIHAAVAGTSGSGWLTGEGTAATILEVPGQQGRQVPLISIARLMSDYGLDRIDLLKMDCEGAEYDICESGEPAVFERISRIVAECHPTSERKNAATLKTRLTGLGFDVSVTPEGSDGLSLLFAKRAPRSVARTAPAI